MCVEKMQTHFLENEKKCWYRKNFIKKNKFEFIIILSFKIFTNFIIKSSTFAKNRDSKETPLRT